MTTYNKDAIYRWRAKNREKCVAYVQKWKAANPDKVAAYRERRKQLDTPERHRKYHLKKYDVTLEVYEAMFNGQGGVCALCGAPPTPKRRLSIDHNHETGVNRGLLCGPCNASLNRIEKDPDWGIKALNYLAKFIEQTVRN